MSLRVKIISIDVIELYGIYSLSDRPALDYWKTGRTMF